MRSAPWARSSRPSAGNSRSRLRWWTSWWWPTADPPTAPPPWPSRLARGSSTSSRCCPRGTVPGKGEALWKSLYDTDGDLVVFIDSDLVAFDPQFVVGLLGPLLTDPDVGYVKALYDRPLTTTDGMIPTGGGRVTELVARPLLNALWPTLAGFVQPLSGEYAGRRELLERVPFVSGYGVELGLLEDLVELADIDALAQVALGTRQHTHQSDAALGRMAGQILQTALARCPGVAVDNDFLVQYVRTGPGVEPVIWDVGVRERPPMRTVPAYAARRSVRASTETRT